MPRVFNPIRVYAAEHDAVDAKLLIQAAQHDRFVDRLVRPADAVVVQIHIQIIQRLHLCHRDIGIDVIHIKGMFGKRQTAVFHKLGTVGDGVHQKIGSRVKAADLIPGDYPSGRDGAAVGDQFPFSVLTVVVQIVGDDEIRTASGALHLLQRVQKLFQRLFLYPVVRIHHLEKHPLRLMQAGHHRRAMTAVFPVDRPDQTGITGSVFLRDVQGLIGGTVVHNQQLQPLAAFQQAFHGPGHVRLRIVARDGNRQKFFHCSPFRV